MSGNGPLPIPYHWGSHLNGSDNLGLDVTPGGPMENPEFHRTMADQHRRRLLIALGAQESKEILHVLEDIDWNGTDMETLRIKLHHIHLPMLEDVGLIDWNRESHTVSKGKRFEEIRADLPTISGNVLTADH